MRKGKHWKNVFLDQFEKNELFDYVLALKDRDNIELTKVKLNLRTRSSMLKPVDIDYTKLFKEMGLLEEYTHLRVIYKLRNENLTFYISKNNNLKPAFERKFFYEIIKVKRLEESWNLFWSKLNARCKAQMNAYYNKIVKGQLFDQEF